MAEPSKQQIEEESPKKKKYKDLSSYVFVGCLIIGLGISFATHTMPVGIFIGMGVGFLLMALIRHKTSDQ